MHRLPAVFAPSACLVRLALCLTVLAQLCCGTQASGPGAHTAIAHEPSALSAHAAVCAPGTRLSTHGVCVPDAWHCSPSYYQGGIADGCDCDCGVPDPDCEQPNVALWCYNAGSPRRVNSCQQCAKP